MPTHDPQIDLAPFEAPRDVPVLQAWLRRPHVVSWWGDANEALAAVRQHRAAAHALITVDGHPVGYVCWQKPPPEELDAAGLRDLPADLIDVDILIGEVDFLGRGIGPAALALLLTRLRAQGVSAAGIACAEDNQRALRAYEKAGFRRFRTFQEAGHDMCYLVRTLHAAV